MLLGKAAKGRVVKPINSVDESGYVYPLNVVEINGHKNQYAFVMGVTHTVCNFDGRIIAALIPKDSENKNLKTMWIMASRSSRYINQDILQLLMLKTIFRNTTSFATMNQVPAQLYIGQLKESFVIFLLKTNARQIGDFLKAILKWAKQNMMQQKEKCLKKQGFISVFNLDMREYQNTSSEIMLIKSFNLCCNYR